jgi:hypothetical protein
MLPVWALVAMLTSCEAPAKKPKPAAADRDAVAEIYTSLAKVNDALLAERPDEECPDATLTSESGDPTVLPLHQSEVLRLLGLPTKTKPADEIVEALTDPHLHALPSQAGLAEFRNEHALVLATDRWRSREYVALFVPLLEKDAEIPEPDGKSFDAGYVAAELLIVRKRDGVPLCSAVMTARSSETVTVRDPGPANSAVASDLHVAVKMAAADTLKTMSRVLRYPAVAADVNDFVEAHANNR